MKTSSIISIIVVLIVVLGAILYVLNNSSNQQNVPSVQTSTPTTQPEENKNIQSSNDDFSAVDETLDNI